MIQSYLLIAYRNLTKNKTYSLINILGLSTAISLCLLIIFYVGYETSFDNFHPDSERLYRITSHELRKEAPSNSALTPIPLAGAIVSQFPNVEQVFRLKRNWEGTIRKQDILFQEKDFFLADPEILQMLKIVMIRGNPSTALNRPNDLVISESLARKYFGDENPIGKTLVYHFEESLDFQVTGVIQDLPLNSHVRFDLLASIDSDPMSRMMSQSWDSNLVWTYIKLAEGAKGDDTRSGFNQFVKSSYPEHLSGSTELGLQAITSIHLHSNLLNEIGPNGDINLVYLFSVLSLLTLIIACINYMNLAIAKSAQRLSEIGVRKIMGASRTQLAMQFLGEAMMLSLVSIIISVAVVQVVLPMFNVIAGTNINPAFVTDPEILLALVMIWLAVGMISGSYPSVVLAGLRPLRSIKNGAALGSGRGKSRFREVLVVSQFTISIICLIGVVFIYNQLNFLNNKSLGYDTDEVIFIRSPQTPINYEAFRDRLMEIPGVSNVTSAGRIPGAAQNWPDGLIGTSDDPQNSIQANYNWVGYGFTETFGLQIIDGETFRPVTPSDERRSVLINETAAAQLGIIEPVGSQIRLFRPGEQVSFRTVVVQGIIKDFHFESLHNAIEPIVIWQGGYPTYLAARIKLNSMNPTLAQIQDIWKELSPDWPLELSFLDETVRRLYDKESKTSDIIAIFSAIALVIACLGLFGLASYSTLKRAKEIGVRKVFGATTSLILLLLTREYIRLILIAFVIGAPVGYFLADWWANQFAYHIDIGPATILSAGLIALVIAISTVAYQAFKAASENPVNTIKYE